MRNWAIIVAGGLGKRIGQDTPKQYLEIKGTPIIEYTLKSFQIAKVIDEIVLVVRDADIQKIKSIMGEKECFAKVKYIAGGGRQRQDSVFSGLKRIWDEVEDDDIILVHDSVRPLIDQESISKCVIEAGRTGACILGIKAKESLKRANEEMIIQETLPNQEIWIAQTPQAFKASVIKAAYEKAQKDGYYGTDDASLVERLPYPVRIICGSFWNIKITFPEDIRIVGEIIGMRNI